MALRTVRALPEADLKTARQIKTGTFRVRLKHEDWPSVDINWLLDLIAPDRKAARKVIANALRKC